MPRITTHPGEVLNEEFLIPLGMSARSLATAIDVAPNRVTEIIRGTRDVTVDTAIRLGLYFNTTSMFWLNLQLAHNLSKALSERNYDNIKPRDMEAAN
jgi:addiction module HigA family antidote